MAYIFVQGPNSSGGKPIDESVSQVPAGVDASTYCNPLIKEAFEKTVSEVYIDAYNKGKQEALQQIKGLLVNIQSSVRSTPEISCVLATVEAVLKQYSNLK